MKRIIYKLLRYSGLPFLIRELIQKNKVTILLFHDIDRQTAEMTFSYLSRNYNVIPLNTLVDAIERKDESAIPKKALIITFDDGHIRNYEMLELLKKYKISITIFLCAAIVNTRRGYWFQIPAIASTREELKKLHTKKRLEYLSSIGFDVEKEYEQPQALQKEQIDQMKPYVDFQGHTMYHPILPMCDYAEARKEILQSKVVLEQQFGLQIKTIAYPNGDYSERDIALAQEAGYKGGLTVDFGYNTIHSHPFRLKRISISDNPDVNELCVKASGLWGFFKTRNGRKQEFGFRNETA